MKTSRQSTVISSSLTRSTYLKLDVFSFSNIIFDPYEANVPMAYVDELPSQWSSSVNQLTGSNAMVAVNGVVIINSCKIKSSGENWVWRVIFFFPFSISSIFNSSASNELPVDTFSEPLRHSWLALEKTLPKTVSCWSN